MKQRNMCLSQTSASYLLRVSTGEKIYIKIPFFLIGREKNVVDYCISDNNTISHLHSRISFHDNAFYITDANSTNHTYVNGEKLNPNVEFLLTDGAIVKLANETFKFVLAAQEYEKPEKYDVFISYKAEEYSEASWTRSILNENGISCWMAPESIPGGSSYADEIELAIKSCSVFVLILSERAQSSQWIKKELDMALGQGLVVLPFMIENCQLHKAFNYYLTDVQRYNAYASKADAMNSMIKRIKSVINADAVSPSVIETPIVKRENDIAVENTPNKHYFRIFLLLGIYLLGLLSPLAVVFIFKMNFTLWMRVLYFAWILGGAFWLWNLIETNPSFAALCYGTLKESDLRGTADSVFAKVTGVFGKKAFIENTLPDGFTSYYKMKRLEFGSWDNEKLNYLKVDFKRSLEYYDPSVLYLHSLSHGGQAIKMLTKQGFALKVTPSFASPLADYLVKGDVHVFLYYKGKSLSRAVLYICDEAELKYRFNGE